MEWQIGGRRDCPSRRALPPPRRPHMELLVRFGVFLSVFSTMAVWEHARPRRRLTHPRRERWVTNLGLISLNTTLVWMTVGGVAYAAAVFAAARGMGLLYWISLPSWAAVALT